MFYCDQFPDGKKPKDVSRCPECGLPNKCGVDAGKGTCWCFRKERIKDHYNDDHCYCESCLDKKIKEL